LEFAKLSRAYLKQAEARLQSSTGAIRVRNYGYSVRLSQETVELATKALLRSMGVEYPKFHDTSPALLAAVGMLPAKDAEFLAKTSETLARKRALAMYGDESRNLGPNEIFKKKDADEAQEQAIRAFKSCKRLMAKLQDRR
jgi:HEPN domain-containing protein